MTIYATWKNAWQRLRQENNGLALVAIAVVLCAIPFRMGFNSVALGLMGASAVYYLVRNRQVRFDFPLLLPVSLFLLMAFSIIWSIDPGASIKALSKEMMLLVIPICFLIFPILTAAGKNRILLIFSRAMVLFALFCLMRAAFRMFSGAGSSVFFYHELVSEMVNAIHVSVFFALAFLWFLVRGSGIRYRWISCGVLLLCLVLLSSKNVSVIVLLLGGGHLLFRGGGLVPKRFRWLAVGAIVLIGIFASGRIYQRVKWELTTLNQENVVLEEEGGKVYKKSIGEAWNNTRFTPSDYFAGLPMRVYQVRIFTELLREDRRYLGGYGLNASYGKISQKALEYNVHPGYGKLNFHNQYIQNFAELGIGGLLLLLVMLGVSLTKGCQSKDFLHISFTILMISVFLTESFLWRQRGVTFFATLYCLFNSATALLPAPEKNASL